MKEKMLKTMLNKFCGSTAIDTRSAQFVAQLVAWRKMSVEEQIHPDLTFSNICKEEAIVEGVRNAFEYLQNDESLGEDSIAFQVDEAWLKGLSEENLKELCGSISSAVDKKLISYEDLIPSILQVISQRSSVEERDISEELAFFMLHILNPGKEDTLYFPLSNSFNLARRSGQYFSNIYVETQSEHAWPWLVNLLEGGNIQVMISDPVRAPGWIDEGKLREFDCTLIKPVWGSRYKEKPDDWFDRFPNKKCLFGEVYQLYHALAQTKKRCVVVVPNVLLQRSSGGELEFKKEMIKRNWLDAVINMDTQFMRHIKVPYSILVLNKERQRQEVLFVDADDDSLEHSRDQISYLEGFEGSQKKNDASTDAFKAFANVVKIYRDFDGGKSVNDFAYKEVNQEMMEESDYNLHVNRYVAPYMYKEIRYSIESNFGDYLESIAELIRPQAVKSKSDTQEGQEFFEISGSDIPTAGWIKQPDKTVIVSEKNLPKTKSQRLIAGDVLLSVKGSIGKVGIVPIPLEGDWLANQSYEILRLKGDSPIKDPRVLYMYLKSHIAQSLLFYRSYGTTIPTVQKRDLLNLRVIIPSDEKQKEIVESFEEEVRLKSKIEKLEKRIQDLNEKHWDVEDYLYGE